MILLLGQIGENPDRLVDTPARMAEMYEELFSGYRMNSELDETFTECRCDHRKRDYIILMDSDAAPVNDRAII